MERSLRVAFSRELRTVAREAAAQYPSYERAIEAHKVRVAAILEAVYPIALRKSARMFDDAVIKAGIVLEQKAKVDRLGKLQRDWARRMSSLKVKEISDTTRNKIQLAISKAQTESMDDQQTADEIERRVGSISGSRALTIARTESHASAQAGGMLAAQELGIVRSKEWVAAEDHRTRETHDEADGQVVAMDDPFIVGGVPLMFPGDPDGPAEEVINCRCVVAYSLEVPAEQESVA